MKKVKLLLAFVWAMVASGLHFMFYHHLKTAGVPWWGLAIYLVPAFLFFWVFYLNNKKIPDTDHFFEMSSQIILRPGRQKNQWQLTPRRVVYAGGYYKDWPNFWARAIGILLAGGVALVEGYSLLIAPVLAIFGAVAVAAANRFLHKKAARATAK